MENGTHALFGSRMGGIRTVENTLGDEVVESLAPGFLCLADRNFFIFSLWNKGQGTGAELVWRVKKEEILTGWDCIESREKGVQRGQTQDEQLQAAPKRALGYRAVDYECLIKIVK
jgi:hypothetical protein